MFDFTIDLSAAINTLVTFVGAILISYFAYRWARKSTEEQAFVNEAKNFQTTFNKTLSELHKNVTNDFKSCAQYIIEAKASENYTAWNRFRFHIPHKQLEAFDAAWETYVSESYSHGSGPGPAWRKVEVAKRLRAIININRLLDFAKGKN